jgi:predicted DsbA family dithiol-disulfide isomerase
MVEETDETTDSEKIPDPDKIFSQPNGSIKKLTKQEQEALRQQQKNADSSTGGRSGNPEDSKKKMLMYTIIGLSIICIAAIIYFQSGEVKIEDIVLGDHYVTGNADAKVTLALFGDFQDPYTKKFYQATMPQLFDEYGDDIKVVFMPMFFDKNRNDRLSAEAAYCAGEQGKYWQMADKIFTRQGQADRPTLLAFTPQIEIDSNKFDQCMDGQAVKDKVDADLEYGKSLMIKTVPTVFVNGIRMAGSYQLEEYKKNIDIALAYEQRAKQAPPTDQ